MAASERVDPTFTISARDLSEIRATHDRPGSIARVLFEELDAALDALQQAEVERDGACAARDRVLEGGIALRAERDRMRAVLSALVHAVEDSCLHFGGCPYAECDEDDLPEDAECECFEPQMSDALAALGASALDREEREAAVEDFGVSVAAVLADPVARAAYVAHQREVAARDMRERAAAHLDSQAEAHDRVAETPGWSPSGQSEHRDLAAALREQAAHVRTLPLTTDREEREAAPASGDPELAAAVARLEGALVYVEPDESDACEHVGYLDCGRTVRRGPLRDVLIALARDVSEEGR